MLHNAHAGTMAQRAEKFNACSGGELLRPDRRDAINKLLRKSSKQAVTISCDGFEKLRRITGKILAAKDFFSRFNSSCFRQRLDPAQLKIATNARGFRLSKFK
jgi:hypothetical protein